METVCVPSRAAFELGVRQHHAQRADWQVPPFWILGALLVEAVKWPLPLKRVPRAHPVVVYS